MSLSLGKEGIGLSSFTEDGEKVCQVHRCSTCVAACIKIMDICILCMIAFFYVDPWSSDIPVYCSFVFF